MKNKIAEELKKLTDYETVCSNALYEYRNAKPNQLTGAESKRIGIILKRMFENEKEFLMENPDDYFEIYND